MVFRVSSGFLRLAAFAGFTALAGLSASAAPADPSGTYLTEDGRARIRIEHCGAGNAQLCGYVVWMRTPRDEAGQVKTDTRNPDPSRRARTILGHQLLVGLKQTANDYQGQVYNNEDGKSYDVTVWLGAPNTLKVKGCLVAFLCSTQDWSRTTDTAPGQLAGATGAADGPQPVSAEWAKAGPQTGPARAPARPRS